jgi:hypothetical protein
MYSIPLSANPLKARTEVIKARRLTEIMLTIGFNLNGTSGSTIIPDNKTIANALNRKPIESLPPGIIIL